MPESRTIMYEKRVWNWAAVWHAGNKTKVTVEKVSIRKKVETRTKKDITFTGDVLAIAQFISQEYADWTTGEKITRSQSGIAEDTGISRPVVNDAFRILTELGMMVMVKSQDERGGTTNEYNLTLPAGFADEVLTSLTPGVKAVYTTCKPALHHLLMSFTQTNKRTTNETNKGTNKSADGAIESNSGQGYSDKDDRSRAAQPLTDSNDNELETMDTINKHSENARSSTTSPDKRGTSVETNSPEVSTTFTPQSEIEKYEEALKKLRMGSDEYTRMSTRIRVLKAKAEGRLSDIPPRKKTVKARTIEIDKEGVLDW